MLMGVTPQQKAMGEKTDLPQTNYLHLKYAKNVREMGTVVFSLEDVYVCSAVIVSNLLAILRMVK